MEIHDPARAARIRRWRVMGVVPELEEDKDDLWMITRVLSHRQVIASGGWVVDTDGLGDHIQPNFASHTHGVCVCVCV